jgi:hypothetical protein
MRHFHAERDPERYLRYLEFFETILPELLSREDLSPADRVLRCISAHRSSASGFATRGELADSWLERLAESSLQREFVNRIQQSDKVDREVLVALARGLGDTGVSLLLATLRVCESGPCRQALVEDLSEGEAPSLRVLRQEIERPGLPSDYVCDLLGILSRGGDPTAAELAARHLGHEDAAVRTAALRAAATLDPAACERWALGALSDRDPGVEDAALKLLFEQRSAAPQLFDFCRHVLSHLDETNVELARRVCAALAGYDAGEARTQSVALLLGVLGDAAPERGGWWAAVRRSVAGEPAHLPVRILACQALGRMRAREGVDALKRLAKHHDAALKQAALHALRRIEGE